MAKAPPTPPAPDAAGRVTLDFEGEPVAARSGETIADALLAADVRVFSRSVKYHRPRGPYCLAGRCSHCLMRVDGEPNVFTCVEPVRDGCRVERQNSFPSASVDVFHAIDWMYPRGLDHHSMFAGVPVVETAMAKVARHLAGLGTLPVAARDERSSCLVLDTDVVVIGAGPAGLAAASAAARAGARVTVLDERDTPGGRLAAGLSCDRGLGADFVADALIAIRSSGGEVLCGTMAFGAYRDGTQGGIAARGPKRRLLLVHAKARIFATGGAEPLPPFENDDLPGVFAGRALARRVASGLRLPAERILVVGEGDEAQAVAAQLSTLGTVVGVLSERPGPAGAAPSLTGSLVRARGRTQVAGAAYLDSSGREQKLRCDLLALVPTPEPLYELGRQAGAFVRWDGSRGLFALQVDDEGRTSADGVWACGDVTEPGTVEAAARAGSAAGQQAAAHAARSEA